MKKLLLMRGAPGCGKSTLLQSLGLDPYALSMDVMRQVRAAPTLLPSGTIGLSQENNNAVYQELKERVRARMEKGEFIALDNTMPTQADFDEWFNLASEHGYDVMVADFGGMPLEQLAVQNAGRYGHKHVRMAVVERIHAKLQSLLPDARGARVTTWDGQHDMASDIEQWLEIPLLDLSGFQRVVHIGDLQGCLTVLIGPGGPLEHGFDPNTAYIFVGDLVDRGIENGALVRWFHENAVGRDNVFLLWGNHEDHLDRFARGLDPVSPEFAERTLPQLLEAGVTPQMAGDIVAMARDVLPYQWHGVKVMACHAGLSTVPERMALISSHQWARGTGHWSDPVDEQFERMSPQDWIQVHGHRNHGAEAIQATPRSFNLEDAVEAGGNLRVATLDASGWTTSAHRNNVFLASRARSKIKIRKHAKGDPVPLESQPPAWMARDSETHMSDTTLQSMVEHPGVRQRNSKRSPHINALNFTKNVFFDASWDDLLVKARGLFINAQTQEIVARGYEKFFNVGERPETQLGALRNTLAWPVVAYVKENGYLGNLGYDSETGDLFVASKSTPDGDFADWFREILESTVSAEQRERLRRWLRDNEASMVFEVIDPVRDPHMIDYDQPHLVLLDVFHRSETPEKLPLEHLQAIGERFGLKTKERAMMFTNAQALEGWYARASSDLSWRYRNADIEGLVLEDKQGFQTKVKLPHYAFWKRMRSAKERVAKSLAQLEQMADDGTVARKDALLTRMAGLKQVVKEHRGQGEEALAAQEQLRQLGPQVAQLSAQLAGTERRERVEEELRYTLARDPHPLAQAFLGWVAGQDSAHVAQSSILQLRKQWLEDTKPDPALWKTPWIAFNNGNEDDDADKDVDPGVATQVKTRAPKR
jgi:predicted kinase